MARSYFDVKTRTPISKWTLLIYTVGNTVTLFLLACLGLAGFPITPTMIGEDLVFSSIREDQYFLALFLAISLIVDGLALVRIYARLFLGPHVKTYHSIAHKSS